MHKQATTYIDMFPRTVVFQKWSKKPTCFHVQML